MAVFMCIFSSGIGEREDPMKGWRMKDRFDGFRFEVHGQVQDTGLVEAIVDKADDYACFGWVQHAAAGRVVGEVRCNKRLGPEFRKWLEHGPWPRGADVSRADFHVYEDTKIKLHFSHFKVLPDQRLTCFRTSPHACPAAPEASDDAHIGDQNAASNRGKGRDEL